MARYTRNEARAWARKHMVGCVNCTIPSFSNDLTQINEAAIRHDARLAVEHGFIGTLGVSEVSITLPEYLDFLRIIKDEVGEKLVVFHHASWNTLEQNIEAVQGAEAAGAEFVLLCYPPMLYLEDEEAIYRYTKAVCDATNLAVILFPIFLWGFADRIHPSDIPVSVLRRLIDDCPNLAAIKAEGGYPSIQGTIECQRLFGEEVVISVPMQSEFMTLAQLMPIQLSATADHEFFGPLMPKVFDLLQAKKFDEVTQIYWQISPALKARSALAPVMHGGFSLNRIMWKYQGWLQGYNGGPLRMPTHRIHDAQMNSLRGAQVKSGLNPSMDPLREFFIGRNPM